MTRIRASDLVNDSICGQLITVVWLWLHLSNKATWTRGDPFKPRPLSCEELFFILLPIRALSPSAFLPSVHFQNGVIRMWPQPSAIHTGSHFPNGDYRVRRPPALTPDQHTHTHTHTWTFKALNTLHDFWLSQTKDWHRETIVAISVIVASNQCSYVVQWERFKDCRFHGLATKDSLRYRMIIAQCVCWCDPCLLTNQ